MARRYFYVSLGILMATTLLPAAASAQAPPYLTQWGTSGARDGQFNWPAGAAVDASGNVDVGDTGNNGFHNNRIQKFTDTGVYLTQWGTQGSDDGQFNGTWGVAVDAAGNVHVADFRNHRIQKFGVAAKVGRGL